MLVPVRRSPVTQSGYLAQRGARVRHWLTGPVQLGKVTLSKHGPLREYILKGSNRIEYKKEEHRMAYAHGTVNSIFCDPSPLVYPFLGASVT